VELRHLTGLRPYAEVHALQEELVGRRLRGEIGDTVVIVEHAPVLTVGRGRGAEAGVVAAGDWPVVRVERGGETTWHGPGQLVAYPIVQLEGPRRDLHRHLRDLEDAVITVLAGLGLAGVRDPRNTGVWLAGADGARRKVCSVGIACRRWVTWHGLALNVDPDPRVWERIRPCGFEPEVMTRLADHLSPCPTVGELVEPVFAALRATLGRPG
jgi:lipoyl(octanoyl) transferase